MSALREILYQKQQVKTDSFFLVNQNIFMRTFSRDSESSCQNSLVKDSIQESINNSFESVALDTQFFLKLTYFYLSIEKNQKL